MLAWTIPGATSHRPNSFRLRRLDGLPSRPDGSWSSKAAITLIASQAPNIGQEGDARQPSFPPASKTEGRRQPRRTRRSLERLRRNTPQRVVLHSPDPRGAPLPRCLDNLWPRSNRDPFRIGLLHPEATIICGWGYEFGSQLSTTRTRDPELFNSSYCHHSSCRASGMIDCAGMAQLPMGEPLPPPEYQTHPTAPFQRFGAAGDERIVRAGPVVGLAVKG